MALYDKWTRAQLRTAVRQELMDPNGRWWTNTELDASISDFQNELQQQFEFAWGTCTLVGTTALHTLSALSPVPLRLDAAYWSDGTCSPTRLTPITKQALDIRFREWRYLLPGQPTVVVQPDSTSLQLVPAPATSGTLVLEYPRVVSFASDASPLSIPAWTRFACIPYCAYRAYKRLGPNQDLTRALIYKSRAAEARQTIRDIYTGYFPYYYPTLRPGNNYERDLLHPQLGGETALPGIVVKLDMKQFTLSGAVDGSNKDFLLAPTPTTLVQLFRNGNLLNPNADYTISAGAITMSNPPATGDTLAAYGG